MHRSRTGLVLIDHPEDGWERAPAFWAGVQGVTPEQGDPDSCTILLDPAGPAFCVVPVQTGSDFERDALTWDD